MDLIFFNLIFFFLIFDNVHILVIHIYIYISLYIVSVLFIHFANIKKKEYMIIRLLIQSDNVLTLSRLFNISTDTHTHTNTYTGVRAQKD